MSIVAALSGVPLATLWGVPSRRAIPPRSGVVSVTGVARVRALARLAGRTERDV
jgi:hypothetical protein